VTYLRPRYPQIQPRKFGHYEQSARRDCRLY
jgi:hypothetical protein